jgi:hypothetical protein
VNQALSVLDPARAHHHAEDIGQKEVGGMIVPVIVVGLAHEFLREAANCKRTAEGLKEAEAPKAGQAAFSEGKLEFPGSPGHNPQSYLKGRFVESPNYIDVTCYSCASTAIR